MDKAAAIDGATPWQTFRYIFLPLAVPIMSVVVELAFIGFINDYPIALVLIRSEQNMILAVGSRLYLNGFRYLWGFRGGGYPGGFADHGGFPDRATLPRVRPW